MKRICLLLLLTSSCATHTAVDEDHGFDSEHDLPIVPKQQDSSFTKNRVSHLLYMTGNGKTESAIDSLLAMRQEDPYIYHEGTLEKLGLALLDQGAKSRDPQDILTCLYGVGISQDERTLGIVENALKYDEPQLQLVAVSVLASFDTHLAASMLEQAMKSNYIFVRLEAAYWLATKHAPDAYGQLVSLMAKVDPVIHEVFPPLFAIEGSTHSHQELKRLMYDENEAVRRESILAVANFRRDDFISDIRILAKEPSTVQQEACAFALGAMNDEGSRELLEKLSLSSCSSVRLAAFRALHTLGSDTAAGSIVQEAEAGNIFAISLLGSLEGGEPLLVKLQQSDDVHVRTNAAIALLQRRDPRCLEGIAHILIDSHRDYTYQPITSHGGSLHCWKVTASSEQQLSSQPQFFEVSLRLKEQLLAQCLELPEDDFLDLAEAIFVTNQNDLVPLTVRLLENLRSQKAIALLKRQEQKPGAPFIRAWCCLGLYRMHQEGPYAEKILKIVEKHEDKEVFKARPVLPWKMRKKESHELTLEESCALLIESFDALAQKQDTKGIEALLTVIKNGNIHNRYTLAGLLMRASS
ncbi:MAG: HEAT repeat domain-containing protein [Chlamydiales bacterium]|nr:HEAT repeat domain-containing protein [Chlamydiales bacterium]